MASLALLIAHCVSGSAVEVSAGCFALVGQENCGEIQKCNAVPYPSSYIAASLHICPLARNSVPLFIHAGLHTAVLQMQVLDVVALQASFVGFESVLGHFAHFLWLLLCVVLLGARVLVNFDLTSLF